MAEEEKPRQKTRSGPSGPSGSSGKSNWPPRGGAHDADKPKEPKKPKRGGAPDADKPKQPKRAAAPKEPKRGAAPDADKPKQPKRAAAPKEPKRAAAPKPPREPKSAAAPDADKPNEPEKTGVTIATQTPIWARELLPCHDDDENVHALFSWSTDREGWGNYYKMVEMDREMVCDDGRGLNLGWEFLCS